MALTLLIAEDEELERRALSRFVQEIPEVGVVVEAHNGIEAVQLAEKTLPDLALVDIKMPGMSGLGVIKEVSSSCPSMKSIVITAYEDFSFAQEALRLGVLDYLLKPAPREEIHGVVRRAVEAIRKEQSHARAEEQLRATVPCVKTALVLDMISGAGLNPRDLAGRAAQAGLTRLPTVALAISIDPRPQDSRRDGSETERQEEKSRVLSVITRICSQEACCLAVPMGADDLAVVFGPSHDDSLETLRLADQLRAQVAAATNGSVTVGVGRLAVAAGELGDSYQDALTALRLGRLVLGTNRVIHIDSVAQPTPVVDPALLELEKNLADRVRWGDGPAVRSTAEVLLQGYLTCYGSSPEGLRTRLMELAVVLSRAAAEGGANGQEGVSLSGPLVRTLQSCCTAEHFRQWLERLMDRLLNMVTRAYSTYTSSLIKQVKEFVQTHYAEPIGVGEVADLVHLNPSYFCRVFKRETGATFIEFLTEVRLGRARGLLALTNEPVSAVARMVGFTDANYFSRVFVRRNGESPVEFRRRVRHAATVPQNA